MGLFDNLFGNVGKQSVEEAHVAINDALAKLDPLLRDVSNRLGGIAHGLVDRFDGATITLTIQLKPIPKAEAVDK